MAKKLQRIQVQHQDPIFKLKPIAQCVRAVVTGGVFIGTFSPAQANQTVVNEAVSQAIPVHALPVVEGATGDHVGANQVIPGTNSSYTITANGNGGYTMTITEGANTTTTLTPLDWQSFDIGAGDKVAIIQPTETSIAVNEVNGQAASQINGQLDANGSVYLINPNGINVGGTASVDTHGLVVSTLDPTKEALTTTTGMDGLANIVSTNGALNASFTANGSSVAGGAAYTGAQQTSSINIAQNANITSENGRAILMFAPNIINAGKVASAGGQVIMAAASDVVYLQEAPTKGAESDVRGLMVEVQTGGNVTNAVSGAIQANHGNITLMGFAVNQQGSLSATTTINENGSIRLVAGQGYNVYQDPNNNNKQELIDPVSTTRTPANGQTETATVTLGSNSITAITPELQYTNGVETTAVSGQAQPQSRVEIVADKVQMDSNALIFAPSGIVSIAATATPADLALAPTLAGQSLGLDASSIQINSGATIDVAGLNSYRTMESNVIAVKLQSTELADSPLQKTGILYGQIVNIDTRVGSPLANLSTELAALPYTLAERLSVGGSISLTSQGSINVEKGATLNVSGGETKFAAGYIDTTALITSNNQIVNIGNASPLVSYKGFYAGNTSQYQPAYVQGANAGSVTINTNQAAFNGKLLGQATSGLYQRTLGQEAQGGTFTVNDNLVGSVQSYSQNIEFASTGGVTGNLVLDTNMLAASGMQTIALNTNGAITVDANSPLQLSAAASLSLQADAIDINSNISGAGAKVNLTTTVGTVFDGHVTIAEGVAVDLQGLWVNDFANAGSSIGNNSILAINGGSFSVNAQEGNVVLSAGSVVDVSGGAWLNGNNTLQNGAAGSISLLATPNNPNNSGIANSGYNLTLAGTLKGYGLTEGGSLSLEANAININAAAQSSSGTGGMQPLQLDAATFFGTGGFAKYNLTADVNGLTVADGTQINLQQSNAVMNTGYQGVASTNNIAAISSITTLPVSERGVSSLSLNVIHPSAQTVNNIINDSNLTVGVGSLINADNGSIISLNSNSSIDFNGGIIDHGGNIQFHITSLNGYQGNSYSVGASQGIWLGKTADIDVSGTAELILNQGSGLTQGNVLAGGNVSFLAERGFIASAAGSKINLAGSQAMLGMPVISNGQQNYVNEMVGSNGGSLKVEAAEGVFMAGDVNAQGGNANGTAGGSLAVSLIYLSSGNTSNNRALIVSQQNPTFFSSGFNSFGDLLPSAMDGLGYVSADAISAAGFSSVSLQADNQILFTGNVNLNISDALVLDAPVFGWQADSSGSAGTVNLNAVSASLGYPSIVNNQNLTEYTIGKATAGLGSLNVNADLVQLQGPSVTDGFAAVNLHAQQDIQLQGVNFNGTTTYLGEFDTYSQLTLTANRIYPTSLSQFTLGVADTVNGVITFQANNTAAPAPVLEAYGALTVNAPYINQDGNLLAPFGSITMHNGAAASTTVSFGANSLTSVSGEGQIIPFGVTNAETAWLYPLNGTSNIQISSSEKKISINADSVISAAGATLDLSGGGDIMAYEFVPGLGGTKDVLAASNGIGGQTSYAVIPGYTGYAPNDAMSTGSGLSLGETITIGAGSSLPAGTYTLLPAHYALLPGAYLITPEASNTPVAAGYSGNRIDGADIVSGYTSTAGTNFKSQVMSEFVVESGSVADTRAQYTLSYGDTFLPQLASTNKTSVPLLPQDAGQLVLAVTSTLDLPTLLTSGVNPAEVDISAKNLVVVNTKTNKAGVVELLASQIDANNIGSLFLGGYRSIDSSTGNTVLNVEASTLTVDAGVTLKASDLILAATNTLEVQNGATVESQGTLANSTNTVLETTGDSAVLRVAAGQQDTLQRTGSAGVTGNLLIDAGAMLAAVNGSILLDTTGNNNALDGSFALGSSGALSIGANTINIGETDNLSLTGLSIDNALLANLQGSEQLEITGRNAIDLYGTVNPVQIKNMVLNTPVLAGMNNNGKAAELDALGTLTLANYAGGTCAGTVCTGTGSGALILNAANLILDSTAGSQFTINGFNTVNFNISNAVTGNGIGSYSIAANNVTLATAAISGATGAKTTFVVNNSNGGTTADTSQLQLNTVAGSTAKTAGVGATLNLSAGSLMMDTRLLYHAGNVNLVADNTALAAGVNALELGANASIDVSATQVSAGLSKPSQLAAGEISLTSTENIAVDQGSQLLLNAGTAGVAAGTLNINAANGSVALNGQITAGAADKALGGQFLLDVNALGNGGFNAINTLATNSGFTGQFNLRLRDGSLDVTNGETVSAQIIKLEADTGLLTVAGVLDASGDAIGNHGGSITLDSNVGVTLSSTAQLLANAYQLGQNGNGGTILISAAHQTANDSNGNLGVDTGSGVQINQGAQLDVSNTGGSQGTVTLAADRQYQNGVYGVNISALGTVTGVVSPVVEAYEYYNAANFGTANTINATDISNIQNDTNTFMNGLTSNTAYTVVPGIEVYSSGNLTLNSAWNFYSNTDSSASALSWRYDGSSLLPGVLTLRAAGDLNIQQNLTDGLGTISPGNDTVSNWIESGLSWSYNLVAGADLSSANNLAVQNSAQNGDLSIGSSNGQVEVVTGTGNINLSAAHNINIGDMPSSNTAVIYTAGATTGTAYNTTKNAISVFNLQYPIGGGNLTVDAGDNITAVPTKGFVNDWLVRVQNSLNSAANWGLALETVTKSNGSTVFAANYNESLGALGGGNVAVKSGGDISNLTVAIPTTCGTTSCQSSAVHGGGDLVLTAGGNIAGGVFYVAKGTADIKAGGSLTTGSAYAGTSGVDPILALGDAQMQIQATLSLALEEIIDPMTLPQSYRALESSNSGSAPIFFSYSQDSAVALTSLSGDVTLITNEDNNTVNGLNVPAPTGSGAVTNLNLYPASLNVAALNGSINILNSISLYPSATGNLNLYAYNTISNIGVGSATSVYVILPDANPNSLATWSAPVNGGSSSAFNFNTQLNALQNFTTQYTQQQHAATPLHTLDNLPVLISTGIGNIQTDFAVNNTNLSFDLAKQTLVSAGGDINGANFLIQQDSTASSSIISAVGNIVYPTLRDSGTQYPVATSSSIDDMTQGIQVWGPGQLTVVSGQNIELGTSDGITSLGNIDNPSLPSGGANITVLAGLAGGTINVTGFAQNFLSNVAGTQAYNDYINQYVKDYISHYNGNLSSVQVLALAQAAAQSSLSNIVQAYGNELLSLMQTYTGNQTLTLAQAQAQFNQLSSSEQAIIDMQLLPYVQTVYFSELKLLAEENAAALLTADKDRLEMSMLATIDTLFPGTTLLSLAGSQNYSYDTASGWLANAGYTDSEIIKNIDINLLQAISAQFGNTINLGNGNTIDVNASIQAINNADNSGVGKSLISSIFTARPDIQAAVRPDKGDISLFFSTIQTAQGGNIDLMTPSGGVDAGLSLTIPSITKNAGDLGIIADTQGAINAVMRNDLQVNLQRVVTLGGGDIFAASTEGSIDAGRGTAGTGAMQPPTVSYDSYGNPVITILPDVSQSGIRSASPADSGVVPGNIVLSAPRGVIDAGESGIGGKNLFLDASSFKNVANITSTGLSVGAPAPASSSVSAALGSSSSAVASVTKSVESTASNSSDNDDEKQKRQRAAATLGILSVELLGYGE